MQMGQANGCSVSSSSSSWSCFARALVLFAGFLLLAGWLAVLVESLEERLRLERRKRVGEDDDCVA